MGQKIGLAVTLLLIVSAGIAANSFGFLRGDDFLYVGKLIGGWTLYTGVIALIYAGIEKLMPGILCAPADDGGNPPTA